MSQTYAERVAQFAQEWAEEKAQTPSPDMPTSDDEAVLVDGDSGYMSDGTNEPFDDEFRFASFNTQEKEHAGRYDASPNAQLGQDTTQALLDSGKVRVDRSGDNGRSKDVYGRNLATLRDAEGRDVGLDLVRAGIADPTKNESSAQAFYDGIAREALGQKRTTNDVVNEAAKNIVEDSRGYEGMHFGQTSAKDRRGTFSKSFDRGIDETQASVGGLLNYLGDMSGNKSLAEYGREMADANTLEASFSPREVGSYEDVAKDPWKAGTYILETVGEMAPGLLADGLVTLFTMGTGLTAVAARRTATGLVSRAVTKGTLDASRARAIKLSLMAGPTVSGAAQAAGAMENRLDAEDEGEHGLASTLSGVVGGAMNLLPYAAVFGDVAKAAGLGDDVIKPVMDGLTNYGKAKAVAGGATKTAAKGGAAEGSASLAQMVIDDVIYASELNKDWDEVTTNYIDDTIRAVIGGGSAAGGAHLGASAMREYTAAREAAELEIAQNEGSPDEEAAFRELYAAQNEDNGATALEEEQESERREARASAVIGTEGNYVSPERLSAMLESGAITPEEVEVFLAKKGIHSRTVPNKSDASPHDLQLDMMVERGRSVLSALRGDPKEAIEQGHLSREAAHVMAKMAEEEPDKALAMANTLTDLMIKSNRKNVDRKELRAEYLEAFNTHRIKRSDIFANSKPQKDWVQGYKNFIIAEQNKGIDNSIDDGIDAEAVAQNVENDAFEADDAAIQFDEASQEIRALGDATVKNMRQRTNSTDDPTLRQAFNKIMKDIAIDLTAKDAESKLTKAEKSYGLDNRNESLPVRRMALVEAADERMREFTRVAEQDALIAKRAEAENLEAEPVVEATDTLPPEVSSEDKAARRRFLLKTNKQIAALEAKGETGSDEHKKLTLWRDSVEAKEKTVVPHKGTLTLRRKADAEETPRSKTKTKPPEAAQVREAKIKATQKAIGIKRVVEAANGQYTKPFVDALEANRVENTGNFETDATNLRNEVNARAVDVPTPAPSSKNMDKVNAVRDAKATKPTRKQLAEQAEKVWLNTAEGKRLGESIATKQKALNGVRGFIAQAKADGKKEVNGVPIADAERKVSQVEKQLKDDIAKSKQSLSEFVSDFTAEEYSPFYDEAVEMRHEDSMDEAARNSPDALYESDRLVTSTEVKVSVAQRFARARSVVKDLRRLVSGDDTTHTVDSRVFDDLEKHLLRTTETEANILGHEYVEGVRNETRSDSPLEVLFGGMQQAPTATGRGDSGQRDSNFNHVGRLNKKAQAELNSLLQAAAGSLKDTGEFHDGTSAMDNLEAFLRKHKLISDAPLLGRERGDDARALADNAISRSIGRRGSKDPNPKTATVGSLAVNVTRSDGTKVVSHVLMDEIVQMGLVVQNRDRTALDRLGETKEKRRADIFEAFLDGIAVFAHASDGDVTYEMGQAKNGDVIWKDSGRKNDAETQAAGIKAAREARVKLFRERGDSKKEAQAKVDKMPDSKFFVKLSEDGEAGPLTYSQALYAHKKSKNTDNTRISRSALMDMLSDIDAELEALDPVAETTPEKTRAYNKPQRALMGDLRAALQTLAKSRRALEVARRDGTPEAIAAAKVDVNEAVRKQISLVDAAARDGVIGTESHTKIKALFKAERKGDRAITERVVEVVEKDAIERGASSITNTPNADNRRAINEGERERDAKRIAELEDMQLLLWNELVMGGEGSLDAQLLVEEYYAKKSALSDGDNVDSMERANEEIRREYTELEAEADYALDLEKSALDSGKTSLDDQIKALKEHPKTEARDERIAALEAQKEDAALLGDMDDAKLAELKDRYGKMKADVGENPKSRADKRTLARAEAMLERLEMTSEHRKNEGFIKGSKPMAKGLEARAKAQLRAQVTPTKVITGIGKLVRTLSTRLDRIHPDVSKRLFNKSGADSGQPNFERDSRFMREAYESEWAKAMSGADEAAINAAWKDARTGKPSTPMGIKALKVIDKFTAEISSKNPNYKAKGIPLVVDLANLNKDRVGFKSLLERAKVKLPEGMTHDDIVDMLLDSKGVVEHAIRPERPNVTGGRGFAELLRPAAKLLEDGGFLVDDVDTTMSRFFASGSAYATWSQIFGAQNAKGEFNENALYQFYSAQVPPRYLGEFRQLVAGVTGQHAHNVPAWLNRLNSVSFAFTAATVLLFSGVASIPEIGVAVGRTRGDVNGVWGDISSHLKNSTRRERDDVAELFGTVAPVMVREAIMSSYDNGTATMGKVGSAITRTVFKYNGQDFITRMSRSLATHWGIKFIEQHGRLAAQGDATSIRLLKELRMTHEDVKSFELERSMNGGNPNLETTAGKKYATALRLFVDESVSNPHAGQMPLWMSDPRFSIFSSLKKFFYAFWDNYHRSVYGEMKKRHGEGHSTMVAAMPLLMSAAVMIPLAAVSELLRELWKYPQTFFPALPKAFGRQQPRDIGDIAVSIAQGTGGLGPLQTAASVYEQAGYGRNFAVSAAGPTSAFALELVTGDVFNNHPSRILGPINQTPWLRRPLDKTWSQWLRED